MISTGIIRSIDSLGRVVLPKELRRTFEITTDTPLEIMTEGDVVPGMGQVDRDGFAIRAGELPVFHQRGRASHSVPP